MYHISVQIGAQKWRTMAWFWVQRNNNHIILLPCFFFLQGFLDLRFAVYYLVWCQQNRGRGWQWSGVLRKTEGCASRITEWKTEEGGGFISITSGMPRTFLEWHVYGTTLGKSTLILWGLLRRQGEAQAGFGILSVCVFMCVHLHVCVRSCKCAFSFMCVRLSCMHVWGLRGGVLGFSGCVAASSLTTFTCLYFGLSAL